MFRDRLFALPLGATLGTTLLLATSALAHVDISGPAFAGTSQIVTFHVGHGCAGADTYRVQVDIPPEVTSVRALPSTFGPADVVTDEAGTVVSVVWTKDAVRPADDHYYEIAMRIGVPDAPFTTLSFPATQSCRTADGEETTVVWGAEPGEEGDPAPVLVVLPPRAPGWNKYTVPARIDDLSLFDDAQIVWAGAAAYSKNPTTMELIRGEADVTELTAIEAGSEIWVKY